MEKIRVCPVCGFVGYTEDAVEVVRCKDCKHRYVTGTATQYYVCDFMDAQYEDDGFCHHGERREP